MKLKILNASCCSQELEGDPAGVSKSVSFVAAHSKTQFNSDDVIFLENGDVVGFITGHSASLKINVYISAAASSEFVQENDFGYWKEYDSDFGKIPASVNLYFYLNPKIFDELYQDVKSGIAPDYIGFRFIFSFSELPKGISLQNHAPFSPLLWDLNALKRLPVGECAFFYDENYEGAKSNEEIVGVGNRKRKTDFFNSVYLIMKETENVRKNLDLANIIHSKILSKIYILNMLIIFIVLIQQIYLYKIW
jgi:hypothetical protein